MSKALITVLGDLMLDRYWFGSAKRISPEAPIPVINVQNNEDRLGGAANVALNLRSLEKDVVLAGLIGNDLEGQRFTELCHQNHIQNNVCIKDDFQTITKLRIISRQQHMLRCDFEQPHTATQLDTQYIQQLLELIEQSNIVILSDYQKGFLADPQQFIKHARVHN